MLNALITILLIGLISYILFVPTINLWIVMVTLTVIVGAIVGIKVLMLLLVFFAVLAGVLFLLTE